MSDAVGAFGDLLAERDELRAKLKMAEAKVAFEQAERRKAIETGRVAVSIEHTNIDLQEVLTRLTAERDDLRAKLSTAQFPKHDDCAHQMARVQAERDDLRTQLAAAEGDAKTARMDSAHWRAALEKFSKKTGAELLQEMSEAKGRVTALGEMTRERDDLRDKLTLALGDVAALREKLAAAEATFDDEEAAHQETLTLLDTQRALAARLAEALEEMHNQFVMGLADTLADIAISKSGHAAIDGARAALAEWEASKK